jgi:tetratricopeptide (TPR) repeat protein
MAGESAVAKNGKPESTGKVLSITELELQFAQNPDSIAYVPLCEAYIAQGRFMEAMVVCKKSIKAHPQAAEPRILLARVYAEQKKYKRGIQELDELLQQQPGSAPALLARGKLYLLAGETEPGVVDLKKALDLDESLSEASQVLKERGIIYPEPKAPPPPPPRPEPTTNDLTTADIQPSRPSIVPRGASIIRPPTLDMPAPSLPPMGGELPPLMPGPQTGPMTPLPRTPSMMGPGMMPVSQTGYPILRQRLEGEDELEALAAKVAEEKPVQGKPKTTLFLLVGMVILAMGLGGYLLLHKRKVEGIDRLSKEGEPAFNKDTYGSYKRAAASFEEILDDYDANHPLTLGRLAHTYAILWGEHGESSLRPRLDEVLAKAKAKAPGVSHTIAAEGLVQLYDGKDRRVAAQAAANLVQPMVQRTKEGGAAPTHADLVLALAEMELGEYEAAVRLLGVIKEGLPSNVRAKVWHARAAARASRLGTARAGYESALRAEPNHPGARAGLALVRLETGDLQGAATELDAFDQLARDRPKEISPKDTALAEFARSEIYRSAGQDAKATGAYENAIRTDPTNADFPFGLGRSLLKGSKAKEALVPLQKAVEMEPTRAAFLVELAEAQMQVEDNAEAEKLVEQVLQRVPDYVPAIVAKARLLRRANKPDTETYIAESQKKYPSAAVDLNLELGRLYRAKNKLDDAKTVFEKTIEDMASSSPALQGEVLLSYGRLMEDRGDVSVALASFKQAAERGAIEGYYRSAIILARGGRPEREEGKKFCDRYLAGGNSMRYYEQAVPLCQGLATP